MADAQLNPGWLKRDVARASQHVLDAALAHIDRERARLKKEFERDIAKLDADERELLGLKPEPTN